MKKIPYGISNFKQLILGNMYYVDKTPYIEMIEKKENFLIFLRPRRFGKSLFLSTLDTYYNLNERERFDTFFSGLYIHKNKTPEANTYMVLRLNFATIITDQGREMLIRSIDELVSSAVDECIFEYRHILGEERLPPQKAKATFAISYLIQLAKRSDQRLLLLIDEYDNFANTIMTQQVNLYSELMQGTGYVKTFYKAIKNATASGILTKIFITGVSPITLDELTSGANIFVNSTNEADLNKLLGFTEDEVMTMVDYYMLERRVNPSHLLDILKKYCDGYQFNPYATETIYNTDMVLYILNTIIKTGRYPDIFIDPNIKTDYIGLKSLITMFVEKNEMMDIIEKEKTGPIVLHDQFNIESLYQEKERQNRFYSLLYYLGLLTIDKGVANKVILKIPNYSIKVLYWDYLLHEFGLERVSNMSRITEAMERMRLKGEVSGIMDIYNRFRNTLTNRDLRWYNETTSRVLMAMLIQLDGVYLIETEREASGGYVDMYLRESARYEDSIHYNYLIEFKHLKNSDLKGDLVKDTREEILVMNRELINTKKEEAKRQLDIYSKDSLLLESTEKEMKKLVIITLGKRFVEYDFI